MSKVTIVVLPITVVCADTLTTTMTTVIASILVGILGVQGQDKSMSTTKTDSSGYHNSFHSFTAA